MTQAERDKLVALKKAKKKLITQKQAAQELGITERHVRRLLPALKRRGDKAVVHALRWLPSNRKIAANTMGADENSIPTRIGSARPIIAEQEVIHARPSVCQFSFLAVGTSLNVSDGRFLATVKARRAAGLLSAHLCK
jgi:hypothetical protein